MSRQTQRVETIRVGDVRANDVIMIRGEWRLVYHAWTEGEEFDAAGRADLAPQVCTYLATEARSYTVIHYYVEEDSLADGQPAEAIIPLRCLDLVKIQVPDATID